MSLSAKDKVALRRQSKRKITPTGLYLYHPASDRWIPAQADEEGRLVIDPSDLDSRYHKKGEDLDMDNHALLNVLGANFKGALDMEAHDISNVSQFGCSLLNVASTSNFEGKPTFKTEIESRAHITSYTVSTQKIGTYLKPFLTLALGQIVELPAASILYRGEIRILRGGADVSDKVYVCLKSEAGDYNWIEIANGGA